MSKKNQNQNANATVQESEVRPLFENIDKVENGTDVETGEIVFRNVTPDDDFIRFWDPKAEPVLIGVLMGEGKTVGEGPKSTRTWHIKRMDGTECLVPQWATFESPEVRFGDLGVGKYYVRIKYVEYVDRKAQGKSSFHKVEVGIAEVPKGKGVAK